MPKGDGIRAYNAKVVKAAADRIARAMIDATRDRLAESGGRSAVVSVQEVARRAALSPRVVGLAWLLDPELLRNAMLNALDDMGVDDRAAWTLEVQRGESGGKVFVVKAPGADPSPAPIVDPPPAPRPFLPFPSLLWD